jgi:uncharacterized membrane protein (DUF106 family)
MANRKIIARADLCHWQSKRNPSRIHLIRNENANGINTKTKIISGSIDLKFVVIVFAILVGIFYIYSINSSATKGSNILQMEKEIAQLKKESEELRIKEAELKSLYHVEEESKKLNMAEVTSISYIEESGPMALK